MSLTFTEKLGFLIEIAEFMSANAETLKAEGFDTDIRLEAQKKKNEAAVSLNNTQEKMKTDLIDQTKAVNAAMREAYVMASGNLDAMGGIIGKDTTKSKVLKKMRSNIRKAGKESENEEKKQA